MKLNLEHVQALNLIDVTFTAGNKKEKKVLDAWQAYSDSLNGCPQERDFEDMALYASAIDVWSSKKDELFIDMLFDMSKVFRFNFNKTLLKNQAYVPAGYLNDDDYKREAQAYIKMLFSGKAGIPVYQIEKPSSPTPKTPTDKSTPTV